MNMQVGDDTRISVPDREGSEAQPAPAAKKAAAPVAAPAAAAAAAAAAASAAAAAAADQKRKAAVEEAKKALQQEKVRRGQCWNSNTTRWFLDCIQKTAKKA
jgi:3-oxoacyl-ACP reductase-like protein